MAGDCRVGIVQEPPPGDHKQGNGAVYGMVTCLVESPGATAVGVVIVAVRGDLPGQCGGPLSDQLVARSLHGHAR